MGTIGLMGGDGGSQTVTMFIVLLHVIHHLQEVDGESKSGQLSTLFKCPGSDESRCAILEVPAETHNSVSRGQCINALNSLGWNWTNFIEDQNARSCSTGQCQLFSHQPRTTTNRPGCTLYKTLSTVVQPEYMTPLCNPELSVPYGVPLDCAFPFTDNGVLYTGCKPNTGCLTINRARFLPCDTNEVAVQVYDVTVSVAGQPTVPAQSIFGWLIWMKASARNYFNWGLDLNAYSNGFGQFSDDNYWLGLERVHQLTYQNDKRLRIEVQHRDTLAWYSVEYWNFKVDIGPVWYNLYISDFSGDAGNGLDYAGNSGEFGENSNGIGFSTYDRDADRSLLNCASQFGGGWWYRGCYWGILTTGSNSEWPTDSTTGSYRFPVIASRMMLKLKP